MEISQATTLKMAPQRLFISQYALMRILIIIRNLMEMLAALAVDLMHILKSEK
jgi:hypothetical protein